MTDALPLYVIGSGGHAKVVVDALLSMGRAPEGITDADPARTGANVLGVPIIGDDSALDALDPGSVELVLGIGTIGPNSPRQKITAAFEAKGFRFAIVIHPSAVICHEVEIGAGAQVLAGAVVHPGSRIGNGAIINFGARVDHDCVIGDFTHIAPGVTLSGSTHIGSNVHIGTGASAIQGLQIGDGALIAAGACVVKNVDAGARVAGVPAKVLGGK